jgi:hypothetical protein
MYNYGLNTADRRTHLKIILVSLIAAVIVVGIGTAARTEIPDMGTRMGTHTGTHMGRSVATTGKPVVWTEAGRVTIR